MLENRTDVRTIQLLMGHTEPVDHGTLFETRNHEGVFGNESPGAASAPVDAKAFLPPSITEPQSRWIVGSRKWRTCFAATAQPIVKSSARYCPRRDAA